MDFQFIKFIHVLLAIVAVGFNASYGIWLARSSTATQATQSHVLRTIKFLDDRFANPAYGLLLITGLLMAFSAGIPFSRLWLAAAIGLWFVLVFVGLGIYTPTLRDQIRVLENEGPGREEYQRLAARGLFAGDGMEALDARGDRRRISERPAGARQRPIRLWQRVHDRCGCVGAHARVDRPELLAIAIVRGAGDDVVRADEERHQRWLKGGNEWKLLDDQIVGAVTVHGRVPQLDAAAPTVPEAPEHRRER